MPRFKPLTANSPRQYLVDGGFTHRDNVTQLEAAGTQVYAPLYQEEKQLEQGKNPYAGKSGDSAEMAAFRLEWEPRRLSRFTNDGRRSPSSPTPIAAIEA